MELPKIFRSLDPAHVPPEKLSTEQLTGKINSLSATFSGNVDAGRQELFEFFQGDIAASDRKEVLKGLKDALAGNQEALDAIAFIEKN